MCVFTYISTCIGSQQDSMRTKCDLFRIEHTHTLSTFLFLSQHSSAAIYMPPRKQPFKNKKAPTAPFRRPPSTRNRPHNLLRQTVVSSSPNRDDSDNNSDEDEEGQEDADSGDSEQDQGGQCQGENNRETRGLSVNIQRQLIIDISVQGGLDFARLKDLCNSKTDVYGESQSKLRRKIQNTVASWKRLTPSASKAVILKIRNKYEFILFINK